MANEKHLARLKQGVKAWNQWRVANRAIRPDLAGAKLARADLAMSNLSGADLSGADLTQADLSGAFLSGAFLSRAFLSGANLARANLSGAFLTGTSLTRADLTEADFTAAHLGAADLTRADLTSADFHEAFVGFTVWGNLDLSVARRIETAQHRSPSTMGIDTLYRSQGNIPEVFLRGAGVPEDFIPYIKSLVGRPFEFYLCFISYNHADKSFAPRLHHQLQARGIRCWLDEHQMLPGDDIYG
jgi:hypothetical protein